MCEEGIELCNMSPVRLLLLSALSWASSPITLTTDLDLRVPAETYSSVALSRAVQGQNLTFSISGHYSDPQGNTLQVPLPTISQRFTLVSQTARATAGVMSAASSQLVEDQLRGFLIYALDGAQVSTWDISNIVKPILVVSSQSFYKGDPLTSLGYFNVEDRSLLLLVTVNQLTVTLGVAETTAISSTVFLSSLTTQFTLPDQFQTVAFAQRENEVVTMLTTASTVEVYSLPLTLQQKATFQYSVSQQDLQTTFTPVFANLEGDQGLLCDAQLGIALFNVSALLTPTPLFQLYVLDSQPLAVGSILTCAYDQYYLAVSTTGGVLQYDVIGGSLQPVARFPRYLHDGEQTALHQAVGLVFPWFTAQYEVSQLPTSTVTTFRVYDDLYHNTNDAVICDVWNQALFGADAVLSPTPAFLPYSLPYADYVLFYSYSSLLVFSLVVGTTLSINTGMATSFVFSGVLSVTNDEQQQQWVQFPLSISGLDSEASTIYPLRGVLPALYSRPLTISGFVEPQFSSAIGFYLPLSNYFSGHNLTYTVSTMDFSDIVLTLPPKWTFVDAYEFTDMSLATWALPLSPLPRVAVIHNYEVALFDVTSSPTLVTSLSPSQADASVFNIASLFCEDETLLVIESGEVDYVTGMYNITWDFYSASDPVSLRLTMEFPESTPSLSLATAECSMFALRGSAVDSFVLNTTGWVLQEGTEVTGNLACAPLNPISIAVTPDAQTLFLYDLTLGLALAQVSTVTQSSFECQLIPNSLQPPNPAIRLEASSNYVYLLLPQASAIPQLIQFDISDLTSVAQTEYLPSLGNCAYVDVSASDTVLTVMCVADTQAQVLVFDPAASSFESLYAAIPVTGGSVYAYSPNGVDVFVLAYDGQNLSRFSLLQKGNGWFPISNLVPHSPALDTYLRLDSPTQQSPRQFYAVELQITATSGLSGLSDTVQVNVTLENPGTFIYADPRLSLSMSPLAAGGSQRVVNSSVTLGLPNLIFSGGDIQYQLLLQSNGSETVIFPSQTCGEQVEPCMLGKASLTESFDQYVFSAFTLLDNKLVGATDNAFVILQGTQQYWAVSQVLPLSLHLGNTSCSTLQQLTPASLQLILAACTAETTSFLAVFNLALLTGTPLFMIDYTVEFLIGAYDWHQQTWLVYASDGLNVNVLMVVPAQQAGLYRLQNFATLNAVGLGLSELYPVALAAANNTYLYLSDYYSHLYALSMDSFEVVHTYFGDTIVAMQLCADNTRIFALTSSGGVLILDSSNLQELRRVPPLSASESVSLWNQLALDSSEEWVAFALHDGNDYIVRVVDLTPVAVHSEVYTSLSAGPFGLGQGNSLQGAVYIVRESAALLEVAVLQQFADNPLPLRFYTVLVNPSVTFYPGPPRSEVVQLVVFNAFSSYTCEPLNVTYGLPSPIDTESPYRSRSAFNHWYVWLLLSIGGFALIIAAGVGLSRLLRRKQEVREDPLLSLPTISKQTE